MGKQVNHGIRLRSHGSRKHLGRSAVLRRCPPAHLSAWIHRKEDNRRGPWDRAVRKAE